MLRCIAIDDEKLALDLIEDNIKRIPFLELVAKSRNPVEALSILQTEEIDLIFVDIQMPGLSGLQFVKSLAKVPMVIFITAYDNYAVEGFNLDAVDYLLKPVSFDRFLKACNKAMQQHQLLQPAVATPVAASAANASTGEYLFVNSDYSLLKIVVEDIMWVEGLKDYIKMHLKSSTRPVITRMTMKNIEEKLAAGKFIRIHKSYIISLAAITAVRKNSVFIGTMELPVSDNYREPFQQLIGAGGQA